jgi:O-antigen/teichoic acid export membrane protein
MITDFPTPPAPLPEKSGASPLSALARLRHWAGLDRAVSLAVVGRSWSLISYPLTLYLIGTRLSALERGFFYSFTSVAGLQIFLELGFSLSIVQFASHEFARLRLAPNGGIEGDPDARSRLVSLGRLALRYYLVMAALFVVIMGSAGHWFFATSRDAGGVNWTGPWWTLCLSTSLNLAFLPFLALLEGCNQIVFVNGCRMAAAMAYGAFLWAALAGGSGLFAAAAASAGMFLVSAMVVAFRWRRFFATFLGRPSGATISWWREIWPFQWRIGCTAVSGYFIFSLFNPVILRARGAVESGRMGMTLQLVNALANVCYSWVSTKTPRFGMLISSRRLDELDALWGRATAQALCVCGIGSGVILAGLYGLRTFSSFGNKFLGYDASLVLLVAAIISVAQFAQAAFLRAHKKEPFLLISLVNAAATSLAVILGAKSGGSVGACLGYALVQAAVLPFTTAIFLRCRRAWRVEGGKPA